MFNPIEMVWGYGKEHTRNEGFRCDSVDAVKKVFINWLKTITPAMAAKYMAHVVKVEEEYRHEEQIPIQAVQDFLVEDEDDYEFLPTEEPDDEENTAVQNLIALMAAEDDEEIIDIL